MGRPPGDLAVVNEIRHLEDKRRCRRAAFVSKSINAIETEKYDPSLPLAFKIARLFTRKIEDIFDDKA